MVHKVSRFAAAGRGKSRDRTNRVCADICNDHNRNFHRSVRPGHISSHLPEHEKATKEDIAAYMNSRQMKSTPATT